MQSRLERKLEGLRYPYGWRDEDMDVARTKQLLLWLEDTKIMWWAVPERAPLRDTTDEAAWMEVLLRYARDMGYTKATQFTVGQPLHTNHEVRALLDWVVGKAVRLHYADGENAAKYHQTHEKYQSLGMSVVTKINNADEVLDIEAEMQYDVSDEDGMQVILDTILAMLKLPPCVDLEASLLLVSRTISDIRCHELTAQAAKAKGRAPPTVASPEDLIGALHSEGLDKHDAALEKAVRLLRLLFIIDLSELQRRISEIFCELQSVTHNIKEDIRYVLYF